MVEMMVDSVTADRAVARTARPNDMVEALGCVVALTPGRVVARFGQRCMTYRDLADAMDVVLPVIRAAGMEDRAAFVAATFMKLPALAGEPDPVAVAQVIDRAISRVLEDARDLAPAAARRAVAPGTREMDVALIRSRASR
jgi:hypothetical protein